MDLGIGSRSIPDNKITASSVQSARTPAKNARVNYTGGSSWCAGASDPRPYLQIDLQTLHIICAVSTQGNSQEDEWVETYTLQSSKDGLVWTDYNAGACEVQVNSVENVCIWVNVVAVNIAMRRGFRDTVQYIDDLGDQIIFSLTI